MFAAIESILQTTLRGTDNASLFAPATHTTGNPLTRAMFQHRRRTGGAPFALVAVAFQSRQVDGSDAFDDADAATRHTLLATLTARLPAGAACAPLDDSNDTLGVFLPGDDDVLAAIGELHRLLDDICHYSLRLQRRCLALRWRSAAAIAPLDGQAPIRLVRVLRERLPTAQWSHDHVGARRQAADEAAAEAERRNNPLSPENAAYYIRAF